MSRRSSRLQSLSSQTSQQENSQVQNSNATRYSSRLRQRNQNHSQNNNNEEDSDVEFDEQKVIYENQSTCNTNGHAIIDLHESGDDEETDSDSDFFTDQKTGIEHEDESEDEESELPTDQFICQKMIRISRIRNIASNVNTWDKWLFDSEDDEDGILPQMVEIASIAVEVNSKNPQFNELKKSIETSHQQLLEMYKRLKIDQHLYSKLLSNMMRGNLNNKSNSLEIENENENKNEIMEDDDNPLKNNDWKSFLNIKRAEMMSNDNQSNNNSNLSSDPVLNEILQNVNEYEIKQMELLNGALVVDEIEDSDDENKDDIKDDESDDDDIDIMQNSKKSITCPLTGAQMRKPMKSNICNHVFEESAILDYIQSKEREFGMVQEFYENAQIVQCPIAGCTQAMNSGCLKRDFQMERYIRKIRNRVDEEDEEDGIDLTVPS